MTLKNKYFLLDLSWLERERETEKERSEPESFLHLNCSALRLFNLIMRLHFIEPGCCVPFGMKVSRWSAG